MTSRDTELRRWNEMMNFRDYYAARGQDPQWKDFRETVEEYKRLIVLHEEELQKAKAEERKARQEYKALMDDVKERVRKLNMKKKAIREEKRKIGRQALDNRGCRKSRFQ